MPHCVLEDIILSTFYRQCNALCGLNVPKSLVTYPRIVTYPGIGHWDRNVTKQNVFVHQVKKICSNSKMIFLSNTKVLGYWFLNKNFMYLFYTKHYKHKVGNAFGYYIHNMNVYRRQL